MVALGSIPCLGYGFQMFPFAQQRIDHVQLRICAAGLFTILTNVYPGIWRGTFRHPDLHDFLVRDVVIECDEELSYQIGGDAAGCRRRLSFRAAPNVVEFAELDANRLTAPRGMLGLLPSPTFAR